jgi:AcrR family transcriptional regulator
MTPGDADAGETIDTGDRTDTETAIMEATSRALRKHGYADVSMAKIAAEFDGSQSLLHYHFGTKDELIAAQVRFGRERYEEWAETLPGDPEKRLDALLTSVVDAEFAGGDTAMMAAIVEMYGRAPDDETLRAELRAYDETFRRLIRETIEDGQADGTFREIDAEAVTWLVFAVHESAVLRDVVGEDADGLWDALEQFVLSEVRR